MICGHGACYSRLKNSAKHLDNIHFISLVSDQHLNDLLNLADIHILPQKRQMRDWVMPSKLSGMMASGKPVFAISHHQSAIADILKDSGMVVTHQNDELLARQLLQLINNPHLRAQLGNQARQYACKHFDRQIVLRQLDSLLCQLGKR